LAFSIRYGANYTQGKTKLCGKSENAVADDRFLSFCMTPTYVMLNPQCDVTGNTSRRIVTFLFFLCAL